MAQEPKGESWPLERYRNYHCLLARLHLDAGLQSEPDASDVVQQTFIEACQAMARYQGQSDPELTAFLRRIQANIQADAAGRFRADARDVALDQSLQADIEQSSSRLEA
ncbi:MAG TPA: hypothetical protein VK395_04505 [Gemmataceae bacterium]|nr:hypothetical protein [Gemmataceae bacterium]